MTFTISLALALQRLQIVAVDLDGQLTFDATHRFFHVVGDRLREIPQRAGNLLELPVDRGNQFFFVLAEIPDATALSASGR